MSAQKNRVRYSTMIDGILCIYHYSVRKSAHNVIEHIFAFRKYSRYPVWYVNTEFGFPAALEKMRFRVILLHYSLFGSLEYKLNRQFYDYLESCEQSYKVIFFQDEYYYCRQRFAFLNKYKIDCIYSCLEPQYYKDVYFKYTDIRNIIYTIPGYVGDDLLADASVYTKPDEERSIDIGYRGRRLPFFTGKGAQEKSQIALLFRERAKHLGLKLDIETDENQRIYGKNWSKFLADCRACLGTEAGVSIFDLEDRVRGECDAVMAENPDITFEELYEKVLYQYEDNIPYRTISPRHFEAAAFRVCQILYEGNYSGVMKPDVHYIPLKKDFSNFDEVIQKYQDKTLRKRIVDTAYQDLIASGKYHYQHFIQEFDQELDKHVTLQPVTEKQVRKIQRLLDSGLLWRKAPVYFKYYLFKDFPGRKWIVYLIYPFLKPLHEFYRAQKAKKQHNQII
jgi:hypothetical protein